MSNSNSSTKSKTLKWSAVFLLLAAVANSAAVPQPDAVAFDTQNQLQQSLGLQKIPAVHNPHFTANGTTALLKAQAKYGFKSTHNGPVNAQTTGNTPAESDSGDLEYLVQVPIGTPAQTLNLDFDTGSSDLWVFSSALPATAKRGHNIFTSALSSTFKALSGYTWSITYGDLSNAQGTVGTDNVNLGGLVVKNQAVELATRASAAFISHNNDGLVGLGFWNGEYGNTVKPTRQKTVIANLIDQGIVPANAQLFTTALYSSRDSGKSSFYTFGYVDQSLVSASGQSIAWTPIDSSLGFWLVPSASAVVNGKTVSRSGNTAIADTGTTLALVSDALVTAVYNAIPGSTYSSTEGGYIFPISSANKLPTVSLAIGTKQFVVQPEDLIYAKTSDGAHYFGGIQSRGDNPFDILGDVFLKSVYAIFDQGNNRLGLVPKIESTQHLNLRGE